MKPLAFVVDQASIGFEISTQNLLIRFDRSVFPRW